MARVQSFSSGCFCRFLDWRCNWALPDDFGLVVGCVVVAFVACELRCRLPAPRLSTGISGNFRRSTSILMRQSLCFSYLTCSLRLGAHACTFLWSSMSKIIDSGLITAVKKKKQQHKKKKLTTRCHSWRDTCACICEPRRTAVAHPQKTRWSCALVS